MTPYEMSLQVLGELFGKDSCFALATASHGKPSQRVVDTYYQDGEFWIVTYAKSQKMAEIAENPHVSLCEGFHTFQGIARYAGHPLQEENKEIREKLTQVFAPWYFAHNDEGDPHMCYVRFKPESGFFHKDGTGYKVNFAAQTAQTIPFDR